MIGEFCDYCENRETQHCDAYIVCYRGIYELVCGEEGMENMLDRLSDFDGIWSDDIMVFRYQDEIDNKTKFGRG